MNGRGPWPKTDPIRIESGVVTTSTYHLVAEDIPTEAVMRRPCGVCRSKKPHVVDTMHLITPEGGILSSRVWRCSHEWLD